MLITIQYGQSLTKTGERIPTDSRKQERSTTFVLS